jgi:hypothetical protein
LPHIAPAFWSKKTSCGIVKLFFKASIQKSQNGSSSQLIKAKSCVKRLDATIGAEDLSNFSSYQILTTDKIGKVTIINEACQKK